MPQKALTLSREVDEGKPLPAGAELPHAHPALHTAVHRRVLGPCEAHVGRVVQVAPG